MKISRFMAIQAVGYAICFSGLFTQCFEITQNYLNYVTYVQMRVSGAKFITSPGLSICFKMEKFTQHQANISVSDKFEILPCTELLLSNYSSSCYLRGKSQKLKSYDKQSCIDEFYITRFIHRDMICFKFIRKTKSVLDLWRTVLGHDKFSLLIKLNLDKTFIQKVDGLSAYVHTKNSIHSVDAYFAQFVKISSRQDLHVSFYYVQFNLLETPYDTNCNSYPSFGTFTEYMIYRINSELISRYNMTSIMSPIYERELHDGVMMPNYENHDFIKLKNKLVDKYKNKARFTCNVRYNFPTYRLSVGEHTSISLLWPDGANFYMRYYPTQTFIDLVVYICSSIGTWLGLSAFSIFEGFGNYYSKSKLLKSYNAMLSMQSRILLIVYESRNQIRKQNARLNSLNFRR